MPKKKKHKMKKKHKNKVEIVQKEFRESKLHSGSKKGPLVTNPKQALAIGLSEERKAGGYVKPMKKKK